MNQDPEFQGIRVWGPGQEDSCRVWGEELEDCEWGGGEMEEIGTMALKQMNQVNLNLNIIFAVYIHITSLLNV